MSVFNKTNDALIIDTFKKSFKEEAVKYLSWTSRSCSIPAGNAIIVDAFVNSWIDCMKLVVCSTIPDILPFFKAESGSIRFKLRCW